MRDSKCAAEPGCPNPGVPVELDCGPIGFEDVPICEVHLAQYQHEGRVFSRLPSTPPACPICAGLRARLESVEAARRDAQESRFALIIQNEELGAELAAIRARLERVEAALRRVHPDFIVIPRRGYVRCRLCFTEAEREEPLRHANFCPFAALGAAGERSEG